MFEYMAAIGSRTEFLFPGETPEGLLETVPLSQQLIWI